MIKWAKHCSYSKLSELFKNKSDALNNLSEALNNLSVSSSTQKRVHKFKKLVRVSKTMTVQQKQQ